MKHAWHLDIRTVATPYDYDHRTELTLVNL